MVSTKWDLNSEEINNWYFCLSFRYAYYSDQESKFEKNWAIAVEYLAAAYYPTTLIRTHDFQSSLPPRILLDTDIAPFIADFTTTQNIVLLSLTVLGATDKLTGKKFLKNTRKKSALYELEDYIN